MKRTYPAILSAPALLTAGLVALGLTAQTPVRGSSAKPARTGVQVYHQLCVTCHGPKGEGTSRYKKPLIGSQSAAQLSAFIAKNMPPGPRRKCVGEDARKVAAYVYDAFYSPIAQARNQPARVDLARLTVRQYRNAVTDLVDSFRSGGEPREDQHGLRGEYFKSRNFRGGDRIIDRVDPQVHFDFGQGAPGPDQFDAHQFSIRWQGSVLAPETGDYDFTVHTEHAVQLWVNDQREPLIDELIKSGSDTEYHGSIFLMGGRAYALRLEFTKSKQGVDDSDKLKNKPIAKASISLDWTPPHGAAEVIPSRDLLPVGSLERYVVTTPFPPDDRSMGYERGTSVSREWDDATTGAALETAAYVDKHLRQLAGAPDEGPNREPKLKDFCRQFCERAFRRPLTPDLEPFFVDQQFQHSPDLDTAVKRVVMLALKSPRFLYREPEQGAGDAYDVASRLSFGLWDSLPDKELLRAAAVGELSTREQIAQQADRMVNDPRTHSKLQEFLLQWLKVDQAPDLGKDPKQFPNFDPLVAADLRTSLELTLNQAAWSDHSDFRDLLLSDKLFLNGRLAKIYGVNLPPDAPFQEVPADSPDRAGILTHPYLMATFAHTDTSSPIRRGVLIVRNLLGRTLQPPPQAFQPLPADQHPNLTTRQRIELQTKPSACVGCHGMINPLGFTLEKFDAIGRFRTEEGGRPIDATGGYQPHVGPAARFSGARDLAQYLAGSEETRTAFTEKLFQYMVKQPVRAYGIQALPDLEQAFTAHQFSIREQLVQTVAVAALGSPPGKEEGGKAKVEGPAAAGKTVARKGKAASPG